MDTKNSDGIPVQNARFLISLKGDGAYDVGFPDSPLMIRLSALGSQPHESDSVRACQHVFHQRERRGFSNFLGSIATGNRARRRSLPENITRGRLTQNR